MPLTTDEAIAAILNSAIDSMSRGSSCAPTGLAITLSGKISSVALDFSSDEARDTSLAKLRAKAITVHASACVILYESFFNSPRITNESSVTDMAGLLSPECLVVVYASPLESRVAEQLFYKTDGELELVGEPHISSNFNVQAFEGIWSAGRA